MFSVCLLVIVFDSPHSAVFRTIPNGIIRLVILASASGLIATLLIQSPWGKRSGAHLNPAVTIAFLRLRRVQPWNALFYILAHLLGACTGVLCILLIAGSTFSEAPVLCAITVPGSAGAFLAFLAETGISMLLMALILFFIRSPRSCSFYRHGYRHFDCDVHRRRITCLGNKHESGAYFGFSIAKSYVEPHMGVSVRPSVGNANRCRDRATLFTCH